MLDEPEIRTTTARHAAVIRLTVSRAEIQTVMGPAIGEVLAAVAAQEKTPTGPVFAHHFRIDPDVFDFEVGVPLDSPVTASGRVTAGTLPAATVARTIYHGPYEGLEAAWGRFDEWITAQGHTLAADVWECYLTGPESADDPSAWQTELNRPLLQQA